MRITTPRGSSVHTTAHTTPQHIITMEEFLAEQFIICPPGRIAAQNGKLIFVDMTGQEHEITRNLRSAVEEIFTNKEGKGIMGAVYKNSPRTCSKAKEIHDAVMENARRIAASKTIPGVQPVDFTYQYKKDGKMRQATSTAFTRPNNKKKVDDFFSFTMQPEYANGPNARRYAPHFGVFATWFSETNSYPDRLKPVMRKNAERVGDTNYCPNTVTPQF